MEIPSFPHHPTTTKADIVLGRNPSLEKARKILDISDSDIEEILEENRERMEEKFEELRKKEHIVYRTDSKKALEVLGYKFSEEKVKKLLGIEQTDVENAKQLSAELFEEHFESLRSKERIVDQSSTKKALHMLGYPLNQKAKRILGLSDEEYRKAVTDKIQRQEEYYSHIRQESAKIQLLRSLENVKAKKILGVGDVILKFEEFPAFHSLPRADSFFHLATAFVVLCAFILMAMLFVKLR